MFAYEIDGSLLTLRASGVLTDAERKHVYDAVCGDALVVPGAMLLIDLMGMEPFMKADAMAAGLRRMIKALREKVGHGCAVVVPVGRTIRMRQMEAAGRIEGLQIKIFHDEVTARQWLIACP